MNKKEWLDYAKEEVKSRVKIRDIYQPPKAKQGGLVCPFCHSGEKGDGAFTIYEDTNRYKCFSCGEHGDVISLYQKLNNVDYSKAVEELGQMIGLYFDEKAARAPKPEKKKEAVLSLTVEEPEKDFMPYYIQCRDRLFAEDRSGEPGLEYIEKRGLDVGICCDFYVGFDPEADPAGKGHKTPRLIIPTSRSHYVARAIYDDKVEKKFRKMNPAGCKAGIFNIKTLNKPTTKEVFIAEGAIDALSFLTVGAEAIALNSAENADKFINYVKANRPRPEITFIIALDNDEAGQKKTAKIAAALRALGIPFAIGRNLYGKHKDANEALCRDKSAFISAVDTARIDTAARPDNVSSYINDFMGEDMERFKRERKTGFPLLDKASGGLYPGVYTLAAISSLGKTSFALQMADQLAAAGEDVIFFSLEMSRLELVSKSIARTIAQEYPDKPVINSLDIRRGKLPADVLPAVAKYQEMVQDRLSIVEANFEVNIDSIADYIQRYIDRTQTRPVVFIDYLQILSPTEEDARKGKREAIDNTITQIKRLSRNLDTPIILISSVNRSNYQAPVDFESLKESGNIEYSSDVVYGLQLQCLNEPLFTDTEGKTIKKRDRVREEKKANPRKIELVCLKNRYGISSFSCYFEYYPTKDLFIEQDKPSFSQGTKKAGKRL